MWPKVFAQLVELLPHITRLVPMADLFFTTKTASEKANEAALKALADTVRTDLGQVTAAHGGLYRQLQDQSAQIAELSVDACRARVAVESYADRLGHVQEEMAKLMLWVKAAVALGVAVLGVGIAVLVRMYRE